MSYLCYPDVYAREDDQAWTKIQEENKAILTEITELCNR